MAKVISGYSREEALRRYEVCRDRFTDGENTLGRNFDLVMEASMLLQRIMDIAKEELKASELSNVPNINTNAWVVPPKGDDQDFWLNKYGLRRWTHKVKKEFNAERPYYWCDRVIIMKDRTVTADITFTEFMEEGYCFYTPEVPEVKVNFNE